MSLTKCETASLKSPSQYALRRRCLESLLLDDLAGEWLTAQHIRCEILKIAFCRPEARCFSARIGNKEVSIRRNIGSGIQLDNHISSILGNCSDGADPLKSLCTGRGLMMVKKRKLKIEGTKWIPPGMMMRWGRRQLVFCRLISGSSMEAVRKQGAAVYQPQ